MAQPAASTTPAQAATAGPMPAPFVTPLHALGRDDLALAGGKGANLGELIRAGLPVPPGFVVTTAAYDRFVVHRRLDQVIAQTPGREDEGAALRAAFEAAPIPPEIEQAVLEAY
jgi:pyruvate,water dikinase